MADIQDEVQLVAGILASSNIQEAVTTTLDTDERVIARVTDGIYRQPASALRELISNAYDADATHVIIKTGAPRFERISVEDDGHGMDERTLARLLKHIGGSAKRSDIGKELGITSELDSMQSPGGRKLIGKIGIGLFSVSQLTHTFEIITKVQGAKFRTVATVVLRQYADDDSSKRKAKPSYEAGKVRIWREPATDLEAHGTTVVLNKIRPQARDTLRTREVWDAIERSEQLAEADDRNTIEPPKFHIGRVDSTGELFKGKEGQLWSLPWEKGDPPDVAFLKLVDCVWDQVEATNPNPQLDRLFDYYLRMAWQLALAVPLPYVDQHPFDMNLAGWAQAFLLSNTPKVVPEKVELDEQTLREKLKLRDPAEKVGKFEVFFDDLQLFRPIKFRDLPPNNNSLKDSLIFIGSCHETFPKLPRELSGGPLTFEAYLFWTPKIAPVEHQGSLVRIHGSSGTLFDPNFMRYQVSELTRLRQITCEIFVREGLDSALNIDRESFNNAHPHSVYIAKWLHAALRNVASTQKRLSAEIRTQNRGASKSKAIGRIQQVATDAWQKEMDDLGAEPPDVEFQEADTKRQRSSGAYVYSRAAVLPENPIARGVRTEIRSQVVETKLKAIAQVGSSRVDLQACKLEYSIVSPK